MASISRRLAEWVAGLQYDQLPDAVKDRARAVLLQGLSSALIGRGLPETSVALKIMEEEGSAGPCSVLCLPVKLARGDAAFLNAEMMLAGSKWDTFRMVTHPGCAVLPAALAAAESTGASGSTFVTGVVAGYEVMLRMASDFVPTVMSRGFHAGPVFGIFGAAVAAARIMGLDADRIHGTLAQCVNLASGNLEGARGGGRAVREGAAVRNALLAVALGRQGGRSADSLFEGPAGFYHAYAGSCDGRLAYSFTGELSAPLERIAQGLGEEWKILETILRIYSTPGYNIGHIDVTAELCRRDGIRAGDVERVECLVNWLETQYPSPAFPSRRTDISPGRERPNYYAAYAILTGGFPVTKDVQHGFGEPDPEGLQEMMSRVTVIPTQDRPLFAPRVTIVTWDGVTHTLQGSGREFLFTFHELASKLAPLGGIVAIGDNGFSRLVDGCARIDEAPDITTLLSLLR
ncbi:MmgE/PrpD family protein [Variovorax sp. LjRoot178]|uniref:MmgE/PrpD family protein n=1 Tax=Variovorax sp. LjRoot178 TaxID=3342277 RepID=UPI003ECC5CC1